MTYKIGQQVRVKVCGTPWDGKIGTITEIRPRVNSDGSIRYVCYTVQLNEDNRELYTSAFDAV